ncbi:MAG: CvpA family protein [Pseudomonadota bacterium]
MIESFTSSFTAFDGAALAIVLVSALMALSRGFMRELATLGAFIAALAAAYYARLGLRDRVAEVLPEEAASWAADLIVVAGAFGIVYIAVSWLGGRVSSTIQGLEGVSIVDRLAGLLFGAARGVVAMVFFTVLLNNGVATDKVPSWIAEAATYPYFEQAASAVNANAPRIAGNAEEQLTRVTLGD